MNTKRLAAGLLFGLAVISAATQAQVITFQDDLVDFLLTNTLTPKTGDFAVGDVLVTPFESSYTIGGVSQLPAGDQLTGLAVIEIASIAGNTISFQPYTGGFNAVSPVGVVNGNAGGGTMVAMWQHAENVDFDFSTSPEVSCNSLAQCLNLVTTGTLIQVDGFGGDADQIWTATGLVGGAFNTNTVLGLDGSVNVALFNLTLQTFFNAAGPIAFRNPLTGLPCVGGLGADACIQGPSGTGTASGGGGPDPLNAGIVLDGAFARGDVDVSKLLAVPEPGILTLLGMALLGLGATRRRRQ